MAACTTAGGTFGGIGTECPPLTEEEALNAAHGVLSPLVACGFAPVSRRSQGASALIDPWVTRPGETFHDFGIGGAAPIPANFFEPGSDPFAGRIQLTGVPLGLPDFGDADTLVTRSADPFDRCGVRSVAGKTVSIEIIALSLASVEPITVTGVGQDTLWDVSVGLSEVNQPIGSLTAFKTHCNGGSYSSVLPVLPKLTFTKVGDPLTVRILDTGLEGLPPIELISPMEDDQHWVHDLDPRMTFAVSAASGFHPGTGSQSQVCGDLDLDGDTDRDDQRAIMAALDTSVGEDGYNPQADIDADGTVSLDDFHQWTCCYSCFTTVPGACCVGEMCIETNELDCQDQGGYFLGEGDQPVTTCQAGVCTLGSCCVEGACQDDAFSDTLAECEGQGGVYIGGVGCDSVPCLQPPILAPPPFDILKNRYISIDPRGAGQTNPNAMHIRVAVATTQIPDLIGFGPWWANPPVNGLPPSPATCISIVTTTKPASEPDWSGCPTLHLTGCPIIPTTTYAISAESGGLLSVPEFLDTMALAAGKWLGDVVGQFSGPPNNEWTDPNFVVNIDDAVAGIKTFIDPNGVNATHLSVTDIHPVLNGFQMTLLVNINDVLLIIAGFQGKTWGQVADPNGGNPPNIPDITQCP